MSTTTETQPVKSNVAQNVEVNLDEIFNAAPSGADMIQDDNAKPKNIFSGINKKADMSFADPDVDDKDDFIYGIEEEIEKTVKSFKLGSKQQEHNLIDALKISCRKFSKEKTGKKPFTNINLVKI